MALPELPGANKEIIMGEIRDMAGYIAEEEERLLAKARAGIAAEQSDPQPRAAVLKKMAESEAAPEPERTQPPCCQDCGYEAEEGGELDSDGLCSECAAPHDDPA